MAELVGGRLARREVRRAEFGRAEFTRAPLDLNVAHVLQGAAHRLANEFGETQRAEVEHRPGITPADADRDEH